MKRKNDRQLMEYFTAPPELMNPRGFAVFFARLANIDTWRDVSPDDKQALLAEFTELIETATPRLKHLHNYIAYSKEEGDDEGAARVAAVIAQTQRRFPEYLREMHRKARDTIRDLLAGKEVVLSTQHVVACLYNGVVEETVRGPSGGLYENLYVFPRQYVSVLSFELAQLLRRRPFPFGVCAVCEKVFVQPARGKRRRYCSTACKAKGIPAAKNQVVYARTWRHKKRNVELDTTRRILQAWPAHDQYWPRLEAEFPRKSRRQLLALIRQATSNSPTQEKEV